MHGKRIRSESWRPPSDALVLAAVERARRHDPRADDDVTLRAIAEHLGMAWGPHASRRLRPILERLDGELGWLTRSRRRGGDHWSLTGAGAERLSLVEGVADALPESPQHRRWRAARDHAAARIDDLRGELGALIATVDALLGADTPPPAADWLACAQPLEDLTVAVALASYCLYERREPDDARADLDDRIEPSGSPVSWRNHRIWDPGCAT
jgi:hypothetical protein